MPAMPWMSSVGTMFATGDPLTDSPAPQSSFRWATLTVKTPSPRIRLDGDTADLPIPVDWLVNPANLAVSARLWVQLYNRRVIVHGATNGPGADNLPPQSARGTWANGATDATGATAQSDRLVAKWRGGVAKIHVDGIRTSSSQNLVATFPATVPKPTAFDEVRATTVQGPVQVWPTFASGGVNMNIHVQGVAATVNQRFTADLVYFY